MRRAEARPSESLLAPLWSSFPNRGSIVEQGFMGAADLILLVNVQRHDLIFPSHVFIIYLCGSYLHKASRRRLSLLHQEHCAFEQADSSRALWAGCSRRSRIAFVTLHSLGPLRAHRASSTCITLRPLRSDGTSIASHALWSFLTGGANRTGLSLVAFVAFWSLCSSRTCRSHAAIARFEDKEFGTAIPRSSAETR